MDENVKETKASKVNDDPDALRDYVDDNYWKIRSCDVYESEYKECKSIKGRFHQYFVFGEFLQCDDWKRDSKDCVKCFANEDLNACKRLMDVEDERMRIRMKLHDENDIWERRTEPPADWNKPLPDWFIEKKGEFGFTEKDKEKLCIIL